MQRRAYLIWLVPALLLGAALLFLLNVSRAGTHVEGCPQGCSTAGGGQGDTLRVLTLNVLHGFPRFDRLEQRLDLVADVIRREQVDIALLQEVPWNRRLGSGAEYLSRRAGLNYVYLRANGNRHTIFFEEGEAILTRFPLVNVSFTELRPRAGFFEHRVALHATAVTPWGDLDLFGTHLTTSEGKINEGQAGSLRLFVEEAGSAPALVGGDFNAQEDSPQMVMLARAWIDTFRASNPGNPGLTCCIDDLSAGPEEPLEERIDYLFFVPRSGLSLEVKAVRRMPDEPVRTATGWLWASDHVGVMAELAAK